ncbi:hypothetical protein Micbo1qcDRAFT_184183 [Microdochium bolleyi]|uniref:Rhodopsin domain-containing protein n=1 Tax=Microdochium bolleyi TaxID=196109 RepID=A0A136IYL4_9PEZI|nr:hypothetical protein Micbo1qcDRAFT_184183 [Microdochium bolleyi]
MDPATAIAPAPEGVTPDFVSISPLQIELVVVFGSTFVIATLFLGLRFYTTLYLTKQIGWDAPLIVLSWLAALGFFVLMLIVLQQKAFPAGFGRHSYNVTMAQLNEYLRLLLGLAFTYIWPPTLAKLSLLFMYRRIDSKMGFPYCIHLAIVAVLAPTLVITYLFAGPCNPTSGDLQCLNNIVIAQATTNILTDVMLILMPLQMTMRLNMPKRQKVTLGCLLTFGSLYVQHSVPVSPPLPPTNLLPLHFQHYYSVVVFSIIRSAFIHYFTTDPDVTYTQAYVAVWSCLELNFGIICNCLAMLQPFLRAHMPRVARKLMGTSITKAAAEERELRRGRAGCMVERGDERWLGELRHAQRRCAQ